MDDTADKKYTQDYDETPVLESTYDDLDKDLIEDFASKVLNNRDIKSSDGTAESILLEMNLIKKVGNKIHPTIAGLLLFGKNPQKYLWASSLKMVKFSGTNKAGHIIEQKEIRGTIPEIINAAELFFVRNMKLYGTVKGLKRTDIPEYPLDAVREIIVNGLIHRDYSMTGSTCRVYMFDDRLEFYSPGGLTSSLTVTNIENIQFLRNRNLMEALYYMGKYVEKLGTGVTRIKNSLKELNLPDPKFFDNGTDFIVIMYGPPNRAMQIEKSDRARKLKRHIGIAKKPEDMDDNYLVDLKKEDREIFEEKIKHEKKKQVAEIHRKSLTKKTIVILVLCAVVLFSFMYYKKTSSSEYIYNNASKYHSLRDYKNASIYYRKFIKKYPQNPLVEDAYYFLAACYEILGDNKSAKEKYNKVISMFPDSQRAGYSYHWLGNILAKENKYDEAIQEFRKAMKVNPEKEIVNASLENIANCYKKTDKYTDVIKIYEEMLRNNNNISDGHELYEIAYAYERLEDMTKAKEFYMKAALNKSSTLEWMEKARKRLLIIEGEKYKIENK
ncbi:MAG: ATP-binding protein [Candidatus Ancaeobacter aquaticus]|nr:ATP-binding protein [Candidatus Ancaeobacter aquaticus]